jgi:hypothetical protein
MNQITRLSLVDRADADLSIVAQCRLLKVARSTLYYRAAPVSADDLRLMRRLDVQYLATPFYGSRRMVAVLRRDDEAVNRKRVRRLMRLMGIEAIYQKPNTSRRHPEHKVYPYLLRDLVIDRPNQVWCADITYITLAKGLCVSGCGDGLVQPACSGMAIIDRVGHDVLRGGVAGRDGSIRAAGHIQHRSGCAVHQRRLH